jgi:quinol monooxygenase YgiN
VRYGYIGSMKTKPGRRDEVVALLLSGVDRLAGVGCEVYLVSLSETDPDTVWVTEVWQSKEHHDASLQLVRKPGWPAVWASSRPAPIPHPAVQPTGAERKPRGNEPARYWSR